jgi:hypothetical protein
VDPEHEEQYIVAADKEREHKAKERAFIQKRYDIHLRGKSNADVKNEFECLFANDPACIPWEKHGPKITYDEFVREANKKHANSHADLVNAMAQWALENPLLMPPAKCTLDGKCTECDMHQEMLFNYH